MINVNAFRARLYKQAGGVNGGGVAFPTPEEMLHTSYKSGGSHAAGSVLGERYGAATSTVVAALAGAALGKIFGNSNDDIAHGAGAGALAGLAVHGAGALGAAFSPTRTPEEQKAHDDSLNAAQWFIPGAAPYNRFKRLGRQMDNMNKSSDEDKPEVKKEKSAKKDDKSDDKPVKKEASALPKEAGVPIGPLVATGAGLLAGHYTGKAIGNKINDKRFKRIIMSLLRSGLIGGGTYALSGLADPDAQHRGLRALGALGAAGGVTAYDVARGELDPTMVKRFARSVGGGHYHPIDRLMEGKVL